MGSSEWEDGRRRGLCEWEAVDSRAGPNVRKPSDLPITADPRHTKNVSGRNNIPLCTNFATKANGNPTPICDGPHTLCSLILRLIATSRSRESAQGPILEFLNVGYICQGRRVCVCDLVFLSRYMRPEGPWHKEGVCVISLFILPHAGRRPMAAAPLPPKRQRYCSTYTLILSQTCRAGHSRAPRRQGRRVHGCFSVLPSALSAPPALSAFSVLLSLLCPEGRPCMLPATLNLVPC